MIILPRQARDKHSESTQKAMRVSQGEAAAAAAAACFEMRAARDLRPGEEVLHSYGREIIRRFRLPFYAKHDDFTKTGSGQTWGKHST
jgi:hypothetical protein